LQVKSVMTSIWRLLVLLVQRGGMTERMTTASRWPRTSRMLGVGLDGSRRIWPAHVGYLVGPDGTRRIDKDRLDDHRG
jgi:hypothetical protein